MNIQNITIHDISVFIAGISGGAVALMRAAKKRKKPIKLKQIMSSLFIAAFTAWLVSLLLPHDLSQDIRTAVCGIAGMSGDKILDILENTYLEYIKFRTGGRRSFHD